MKQSGSSRSPLAFLDEELAELERRQLYRRPPEPHKGLSFCSNDYLGLAATPPPPAIASGAGASRLIAGQKPEHELLECSFAEWLGYPAALAFTSGYAANVGVVSALVRPSDHVISDALNHASLIDGARLSRGRVTVVPHLDLDAVQRALATTLDDARAWVVVESYYSMDADGPDLPALRRLCTERGAGLIVDEAHALGVLGPRGRGLCAEAGVVPDVLVGTLGKAFGAQGALVFGSTSLRRWLWNRARSFVFSTGLAPASAAAATQSLAWLLEHPETPARVTALASRLREGLFAIDPKLPVMGFGHVVPVRVGSPDRALQLAAELRARGVAVQAIRPPTVPEGSSRLRLTVTASHSEGDVDQALEAFRASWTNLRVER